MKMKPTTCLILLGMLWNQASGQNALSQKSVIASMRKVADYQLANPTGKPLNVWEYGPFYQGIMRLYQVTADKKYLDATEAMGEKINWEPQPMPYDANSLAIVPALADLYEIKKDPKILDKSRFLMDMPPRRRIFTMENMKEKFPPEVNLANNRYWYEWWTWCDALFMAPPAYAKLSKILKRPDYMSFMVKNWWLTSDYLYSKSDSLFFRDDRFFRERTANGKKVFWARGNGWVVGGLVGVLKELEQKDPNRKKFEQQFIQMSEKLLTLQMENGCWSQSLLDARAHPQKETSGTAFICYAFAWGIKSGLLQKDKFMPALQRGWNSMTEAIHPNGKLGFVQRVGDKPENVKFEDTESYGSGAFILAGCELSGLLK
jgi:rhamnogalacturonyl hydrolase YesR